MVKQKDTFLSDEGDEWFLRNERSIGKKNLPDDDSILIELLELVSPGSTELKVLEIGCGEGSRLEWIKQNLHAQCFGIDPSEKAVVGARSKGVKAVQGTADNLPFENKFFDVVIFGFCLYLCDREDLFLISKEADRVLKAPGWLLIIDFYSPQPVTKAYHHVSGLFSYKMDYSSLFTWHPCYECLTSKVRHHVDMNYTDSVEDWVSTSVLRKLQVDQL
jgi:ubiquinone/menaquinone biosynthesis C-methylase UbiE